MVCVFLTGAFLVATLVSDDLRVPTHATGMLVPLLAVYLLGGRLGFIFTAIVCLGVGLFHQLYHSGFGSKWPVFANTEAWVSNVSSVVALLMGAGLFWLHFTQGFTTKKEGHGFGLHTSALAAAELGGMLTCSSTGPGQGATFLVELPARRNHA